MVKIAELLSGQQLERLRKLAEPPRSAATAARPPPAPVVEVRVAAWDVSALSLEELRRELDARRAFAAAVTDQLKADAANGYQLAHGERFRLSRERAVANGERQVLEARLRDFPPTSRQLEHQERQMAERVARAARRAANMAAHEARQAAVRTAKASRRAEIAAATRTREWLFLRAARIELGEARCRELWQRARALFPDEPAWAADDDPGARA